MRGLNLILLVLLGIIYDLVSSDDPSCTLNNDLSGANDQNYPCGSSGRSVSLILNGTQSERGAWPWLVTLHKFQTNELICGGTLISFNAVVTVSIFFDNLVDL